MTGNTYISNADVLFSNPDLPHLHITFQGTHEINVIQPALKSLSRLKVLMPSRTDFCHHRSAATGPQPKQGLARTGTLPTLWPISIRRIWRTEHQIHQFQWYLGGQHGHCPTDPTLSQSRDFDVPERGCPNTDLAQGIRDRCPKLIFLKCGLLREVDVVLLIRAPPRLTKLHTDLCSFSSKVCDALLGHAGWIEELCLSFTDAIGESAQSANRILTSCPNLRRLKVVFDGYSVSQDYGPVNVWQKEPWKCTKLESLPLYGLVRDWTSGSPLVLQ